MHFGDLSNLKICEIGVGYGGQARIILAKFPQVASYTLIDLQSALNLSEKYLSYFSDIQADLRLKTLDNLGDDDYDLVISNYAFSELSRAIQELYLAKIINRSKHGYITYNDISSANLASYKISEYKNLIHKNIKILEEVPQTHPLNKIVVW